MTIGGLLIRNNFKAEPKELGNLREKLNRVIFHISISAQLKISSIN